MRCALHLGFIALTDAAPLIVAREHGFFEIERLDVTLRREVSWATVRDRVAMGLYQGAHMLAPAALALNLGVGSEPANVIAPLSLNAHGAAIGVGPALAAEMAAQSPAAPKSAEALALAARQRQAETKPPPRFAVVFPYSMHNYLLRHWLASVGLDPDRDVRIVVAAPTMIAARLRAGDIDGFCVGAPWATACAAESEAIIVLESGAYWPGGPDKVLGLSATWAESEPEAALALVRAVLRASLWAGAPENAEALAQLLARSDLVNAPAAQIAAGLSGDDTHRLRFAREHAAFPWRSHARWILMQMWRWGQIDGGCNIARAANAYRPDLYRNAAAQLGLAAPRTDIADGVPSGESTPPSLAFDAESLRRDAASYEISRAKA